MHNSHSHCPSHRQDSVQIPCQNVIPPHQQHQQGAITFTYCIKGSFRRQHCNPPIWFDLHVHTFEVTLELQAICQPGDLYGLDMVEMENRLAFWIEQLPAVINQHPACPHGTTEEICLYFAQIPVDSHGQLLKVSVSETPNRITILKLASDLA
ncbi:MAG: 6-carboxytetrahydropterin synthase [Microcoleaceae cyanobacterium]